MTAPTAQYMTQKAQALAATIAEEHGVTKEGVIGVALTLTLTDPEKVQQIVALIKHLELGGAQDMSKKGW